MNKVEKSDLELRKAKLQRENENRVAQVQQWNQQIAELQRAIQVTKEQHDYTRGQIDVLNDLLGDEEQAEPLETEEPSDAGNSEPQTEA